MKLTVVLLRAAFVVFGIGAVIVFFDARANVAVLRDGVGLVTLINAEWVALLILSVVCGATALILAYLGRAVDVLAPLMERPERAVDEA